MMSETLREEVDRLTLGLVNAVMDQTTTIDIIGSLHRQFVDELCAMFERRAAWRPIETAPRDGTDILLLVGSRLYAETHLGWWSCHRRHWHYFEMCGDDNLNSCSDELVVGWSPLPTAKGWLTDG